MGGERDGDGSGAGADVGQTEAPVVRKVDLLDVMQDGFDEQFGFGARDERGGGDAERQAEELLHAGDVLDGLVGEAAGDCFVEGSVFDGSERARRVGIEGSAGERERVEEKELGVAAGGGGEVGVLVQALDGLDEGFAQSHRGSFAPGSVGRMVDVTASWW